MNELVFVNNNIEYSTDIQTLVAKDTIPMVLDTGSPISIICIPNLVQITGEPWAIIVKKIDNIIDDNEAVIEFGLYGNDIKENNNSANKYRKFVPYLVKNVIISNVKIPYFIFWVDITNYKDKSYITSALFGFDNISVGEKWFDEDDNFHIRVQNCFNKDLYGVKKALSNFNDRPASIKELIPPQYMNDIVVNKDYHRDFSYEELLSKYNELKTINIGLMATLKAMSN